MHAPGNTEIPMGKESVCCQFVTIELDVRGFIGGSR